MEKTTVQIRLISGDNHPFHTLGFNEQIYLTSFRNSGKQQDWYFQQDVRYGCSRRKILNSSALYFHTNQPTAFLHIEQQPWLLLWNNELIGVDQIRVHPPRPFECQE